MVAPGDVQPGDRVGYRHKGALLVGIVGKVQRKTVSVYLEGRKKEHSNVPFSAIVLVVEGRDRGDHLRRAS